MQNEYATEKTIQNIPKPEAEYQSGNGHTAKEGIQIHVNHTKIKDYLIT